MPCLWFIFICPPGGFPPINVKPASRDVQYYTLIKNKTKFASYIRKFRWDRVHSHVWGRASQYMRKCTNIFTIYEDWRSLVIYDFAPEPSEFPNIWGKFYFIFYQCTCTHSYKHTPVHKVGLWYWTTNACLLSFFRSKENSQICYDILHCWSYLQNFGFEILRGRCF